VTQILISVSRELKCSSKAILLMHHC